MRVLVVVVIPGSFILLLEGLLALLGTGTPTAYLLKDASRDGIVFQTNPFFTQRFFPPALARGLIPHRFPQKKANNGFRILIFGESAANGDPDSAYSFGRHLECLLENRFPQTDFEIINTGITAINSHVIVPIAKACAEVEADLWILYMGNNEAVGPYGPSTVFGMKAPPLPLIQVNRALKTTRIGQLLQTAMTASRNAGATPETWGGIEMFSENLLRANDPVRDRLYAHFESNLKGILEYAEEAEVRVILSTVAVNLQDSAPFASLHRKGLTEPERVQWESLYFLGHQRARDQMWAEALAAYEEAWEIDREFAELAYWIGVSHGVLGNREKALEFLRDARNLDALMVRADDRTNEVIRKLSREGDRPAVTLLDADTRIAEAAFANPEQKLFYEHVHFTLKGNDLMARLLAEEVREGLPTGILAQDTGSWPNVGVVQRKLAVSIADQQRLWIEIGERLSTPPFTDRSNNAAMLTYAGNEARRLAGKMNPRIDLLIYELALKENPDDFHLRSKFGRYLLENGQIGRATEQFQWVVDQFPLHDGGYQELGLALFLEGRYAEAKAAFEKVLEFRPGYARAIKGLEWIEEAARKD